MKNEILIELARRWENMAHPPNVVDEKESAVSPSDWRREGMEAGERQTLRMCADTLRTLIEILGGDDDH